MFGRAWKGKSQRKDLTGSMKSCGHVVVSPTSITRRKKWKARSGCRVQLAHTGVNYELRDEEKRPIHIANVVVVYLVVELFILRQCYEQHSA